MTEHRLDPTPGAVTDVFDPSIPPVLTVDPGDTLVVHTLNASGHLARKQSPDDDPERLIPNIRGHCLAGPIAVRGARPGMTLGVTLVALTPDEWGFTVAGSRDTPLNRRLGVAGGSPAWLLWDLDRDKLTGTNNLGFTVDLAPFLGVIGLPPAEPGAHPTGPPRTVGGGNIDCRDLVAGSTLYLPVTVPDALLCVGDGHAAQGDGEVSGTAIECGMTTELRLDLTTDRPLDSVHAETPTSRITFGFDQDLNEAMVAALDAMVDWMRSIFDLDKATALALASTVVDLRVTQVANGVWGVHAVLPNSAVR
ncbi:acetamidase/formamidase family protein [Actinopolymorpha pittospori]|uniref:Acetamidase/formamidase n=1 Tax=Actinopolymorpha pittospori TaxID=648752 RepID=A0A927N257_9ACTN|nr:acetamidase/formamidase family protein [Actinopolymorpha pittospori]MBE1607542.1 acetamidase/formamidase [Actinopolymorpha pittospori]